MRFNVILRDCDELGFGGGMACGPERVESDWHFTGKLADGSRSACARYMNKSNKKNSSALNAAFLVAGLTIFAAGPFTILGLAIVFESAAMTTPKLDREVQATVQKVTLSPIMSVTHSTRG